MKKFNCLLSGILLVSIYGFADIAQSAGVETENKGDFDKLFGKSESKEKDEKNKKKEGSISNENKSKKIEKKAENTGAEHDSDSEENKKDRDIKDSDISKTSDGAEGSSKEKSEAVETAAGKVSASFKDGTKIHESKIMEEMNSIPDQLSAKMSLLEIKSFLIWKAIYNHVMMKAVKDSKIAENPEVKELIEKRVSTAAGFMLMDEGAKKLMTKDALKKHYDKVWDETFKGTKEFSLIAITATDKKIAEKIQNTVKNEKALKDIADSNKSVVKIMELNDRAEGMFPAEISSAVLKQGVNTVVGPFAINGNFMMFFVKKVDDAKKHEFDSAFEEGYRKVAAKDFIKEYTMSLYKKYGVKILDTEGKEVNPFKIVEQASNNSNDKSKEDEKKKSKDKKKKSVDISKIKDTDVFAHIGTDKITAADLKEYFKIKSLEDESFLSMAKQFEITPAEVILYAVKLMADDRVLAKEVTSLNYTKKPKVAKKIKEMTDMELEHGYLRTKVIVSSEDLQRTYKKFIASIPEEDKNDNEIATRLVFFATKEDASAALQGILSGKTKFSDLYKEKSVKDKSVIDLGYLRKQKTDPAVWEILKKGASGTCHKEIVEIDGEKYGVQGKKYAIINISDRRPISLPSLANPQEKQYFQRLAEKEKAAEIISALFAKEVETIAGKPYSKYSEDEIKRTVSILIGMPN